MLLFKHPNAGIQIPAGTVEDDETPEEAALWEVSEETGLTTLSLGQYLGCRDLRLPGRQRIVAESTIVYARPDVTMSITGGCRMEYWPMPGGDTSSI